MISGEKHKPKLLNKIAFTAHNRKLTQESESDGQFMWLSNDIENRLGFCSDHVCNHPKTVNVYLNLLRLVRDFYRPSSWEMTRRDLPIYIMAGDLRRRVCVICAEIPRRYRIQRCARGDVPRDAS